MYTYEVLFFSDTLDKVQRKKCQYESKEELIEDIKRKLVNPNTIGIRVTRDRNVKLFYGKAFPLYRWIK